MDINDFKKLCKIKGKVIEHNSCNGWGFGGLYGKIYQFGNKEYWDTRCSTRHQGTHSSKRYYLNDKEINIGPFKKALLRMRTKV